MKSTIINTNPRTEVMSSTRRDIWSEMTKLDPIWTHYETGTENNFLRWRIQLSSIAYYDLGFTIMTDATHDYAVTRLLRLQRDSAVPTKGWRYLEDYFGSWNGNTTYDIPRSPEALWWLEDYSRMKHALR